MCCVLCVVCCADGCAAQHGQTCSQERKLPTDAVSTCLFLSQSESLARPIILFLRFLDGFAFCVSRSDPAPKINTQRKTDFSPRFLHRHVIGGSLNSTKNSLQRRYATVCMPERAGKGDSSFTAIRGNKKNTIYHKTLFIILHMACRYDAHLPKGYSEGLAPRERVP